MSEYPKTYVKGDRSKNVGTPAAEVAARHDGWILQGTTPYQPGAFIPPPAGGQADVVNPGDSVKLAGEGGQGDADQSTPAAPRRRQPK